MVCLWCGVIDDGDDDDNYLFSIVWILATRSSIKNVLFFRILWKFDEFDSSINANLSWEFFGSKYA